MKALLLAMLVSYATGVVLPFFLKKPAALSVTAASLPAILGTIFGFILGLRAVLSGAPAVFAVDSNLPFLDLSLSLDALSGFFVATISLVGFPASIYAFGSLASHEPARVPLLGAMYNLFLASMTLVVLANNGLLFLVVWEVMSLASYFLVVTEHEKAEVRYAGLFYLVMAHLGTAFILLTFLMFFQEAGSFSFQDFRQAGQALPESMRAAAFLTALIGFGVKAGIVPLHVWLPYAHPAAPSHVSALMSGVMIKTAIYGLLRVSFDFMGGEFAWWWGVLLLAFGTVSAFLGVLYALMEHDIKSLLAFHSVENIGIIVMAIGAAMVFRVYGLNELAALGLLAALYHTLNHAVFKGLLFLGAGAVVSSTGGKNIEDYGGLLRRMPWTGAFFLVGSASIIALPPTNGFVSEWLVFQTLFLSFHLPTLLLKFMLPLAAAILALTAALALACFAKAFGIAFLGLPRSHHAAAAREVPVSMRVGMGFLASWCFLLGLAPLAVVPLLDRMTAPFVGTAIAEKALALEGWALTPANAEFSSISPAALAVMLVALGLLGLGLARWFGGALRRRSSHTWNCGLPLSPRMQYSAIGFVQPIKRIFSTIYRPTIKLETEFLEESRYFAKRRRFEFHIEPVIQRVLYEPVAAWFQRAADRLRVVQAGSIHVYLSYIFVVLVLLLVAAS
ncbi:hydrogenase 4 subunit B [Candidatus Nitrospira bockiana]